jgi:hypothetical protein
MRTVRCWAAVSRGGRVQAFLSEPGRDTMRGIWRAPDVYVNSHVMPEIRSMMEDLTWDDDPEYIEMTLAED